MNFSCRNDGILALLVTVSLYSPSLHRSRYSSLLSAIQALEMWKRGFWVNRNYFSSVTLKRGMNVVTETQSWYYEINITIGYKHKDRLHAHHPSFPSIILLHKLQNYCFLSVDQLGHIEKTVLQKKRSV